jgi:hypothetical protein
MAILAPAFSSRFFHRLRRPENPGQASASPSSHDKASAKNGNGKETRAQIDAAHRREHSEACHRKACGAGENT